VLKNTNINFKPFGVAGKYGTDTCLTEPARHHITVGLVESITEKIRIYRIGSTYAVPIRIQIYFADSDLIRKTAYEKVQSGLSRE